MSDLGDEISIMKSHILIFFFPVLSNIKAWT